MSKTIDNLSSKNINYFIIDAKIVDVDFSKINLTPIKSDFINISLLHKGLNSESLLDYAIKNKCGGFFASKASVVFENTIKDISIVDGLITVDSNYIINSVIDNIVSKIDSVFKNKETFEDVLNLIMRYLDRYVVSGIQIYNTRNNTDMFVSPTSTIKYVEKGRFTSSDTTYDEFISYLNFIVQNSDSKLLELCTIIKDNFPNNMQEIILDNDKLRKECYSKSITITELIEKNSSDKNNLIHAILREEVLRAKESIKESMLNGLKTELSTVNQVLKDEILVFKDIVSNEVKDINGHIDIFKTDIYKKMSKQITELNNEVLTLKNDNNSINKRYDYLNKKHTEMVFVDDKIVHLICRIHDCLKDVFAVIDSKFYSNELTYKTYIGELSGIRNNIFHELNVMVVNKKNKTISKKDMSDMMEFFNDELDNLMEIKDELSKLGNKDGSADEYKSTSGGLLSRVKNFVGEKLNNKTNNTKEEK